MEGLPLKLLSAVLVWLAILPHYADCMPEVSITTPLIGRVGQSLIIECSAFVRGTEIVYESPNIISIRRNEVVFSSNRLSSSINQTHKMYTLDDLTLEDADSRIQCAVSEITSDEVPIQIYYRPTLVNYSGPAVEPDGSILLAAGGATNITFFIDASPTPVNTILTSSNESAPSSFSIAGSSIIIRDVDRNDAGMYNFVSTNDVGSAAMGLSLTVEYPPIFIVTITETFSCNFTSPQLYCAARVEESGAFFCDFQSNPAGNLQVSVDVPNNSSVRVLNSRIMIDSAGPDNAGMYTCVASNSVLGQPANTTREIQFYVGAVPIAVADGQSMVNSDGSVIISWTYSNENSIPLSSFRIVGGVIDRTIGDTINMTVAADVRRVTLNPDTLLLNNGYSVSISAVNILGSSDGMAVTFSTPVITTPPPPTSTTTTTTSGNTMTAVSHLLSIALLIFCVFLL